MGIFDFDMDEIYHRELLIEKRTAPSYISEDGDETWVDRYGNIINPHQYISFLEAGYVYAPYIPMTVSPVVLAREYNTLTGTTTVGISSRGTGTIVERYGTTRVNPNFYRNMSCDIVTTANTTTSTFFYDVDPV